MSTAGIPLPPVPPMEEHFHIRSAKFPNVFLRLDGTGVTQYNGSNLGKANCQFGAGPWETFRKINNGDGTVSFGSIAFDNVFLRMDSSQVKAFDPNGSGTVDAQYTAGAWEKYKVTPDANTPRLVTLGSASYENTFLRLDGKGVTHFNGAGSGTVNCQFGAGDYEKFILQNCCSPQEAAQCISMLGNWFPEQGLLLSQYQADIIAACCPPFTLDPVVEARLRAVPKPDMPAPASEKGTECDVAVLNAVISGVSLALRLVGLSLPRVDPGVLLRAMGGSAVNAIKAILYEIRYGESLGAQLLALFRLISQTYNAGGIKVFLNALYESMSWWDWIKASVIFVAQVVAWIASEGAAFVAEMILIGFASSTFLTDVINAGNTCAKFA